MKSTKRLPVYLDRNENQFGPAPECFEVLRRATKNELSNYSRDFTRGVKSALSETLAKEHGISETHVLLSYGSEDMLKQIVHCYLGAGESIMIPQHSWWYYKSVAGEVDGKVVEYFLHADEQCFSYDLEEITAKVRNAGPQLLLIASPNNPTGNSLSLKDLRRLLNECASTKVIIDEAYFGFNGAASGSIPRLTLEYPNLALLRTFSKLYALAGVRIGYAFVGGQYSKLIAYSARYLGYNQLSEQLALAALQDGAYYHSLAETTAKERERYYSFFHLVEGCRAYRSDANFILVKLATPDVEPLKKHLEASGVFIKFFPEKEFSGHARITIGTPDQNSRLLNALREYFVRENVLIPEFP